MRLWLALVLGGVFLAQAGMAHSESGNAEDGRKKAGSCRTCHGIDGFAKIPIAPHIGGEPKAYLANQLTAFRDGTREHEMMTVVAKGLDDQTIADLAAWYGSHTASAELPASMDPQQAPELCSACHGVSGLAEVEDAPHLAGESAIYIDTQLKAFRSGKRTHEVMSEIAADLTDEDIRNFADWYAAAELTIQPPE